MNIKYLIHIDISYKSAVFEFDKIESAVCVLRELVLSALPDGEDTPHVWLEAVTKEEENNGEDEDV